MLKEGMLKKGGLSIKHQREYIQNNPHHARQIFATCPSYIYFKLTDEEPIGIQRLLARPTAEYCAEVKTLKEMRENHYRA